MRSMLALGPAQQEDHRELAAENRHPAVLEASAGGVNRRRNLVDQAGPIGAEPP